MRNLTEKEYGIVEDAYLNKHRGLVYCGKLVNCGPQIVRRELKKHGVEIRNFSQAASLSDKNREKYKDFSYFKTQSHNMAWIMGFIAADGTISKDCNRIKIGLALKDKEILEKIKEELKLEPEIKVYRSNNGHDCCSLTWTCEEHKKDLAYYNIVPAKTFILKPPLNLSKEYYIDFIRGYFDGDGSVNLIHQKKGNSLRWQICSANKDFLSWIVETLYSQYGIKKVNIQMAMRVHPLYYFQYSTNATKEIYKILYSENSLSLLRKKQHFEEILK